MKKTVVLLAGVASAVVVAVAIRQAADSTKESPPDRQPDATASSLGGSIDAGVEETPTGGRPGPRPSSSRSSASGSDASSRRAAARPSSEERDAPDSEQPPGSEEREIDPETLKDETILAAEEPEEETDAPDSEHAPGSDEREIDPETLKDKTILAAEEGEPRGHPRPAGSSSEGGGTEERPSTKEDRVPTEWELVGIGPVSTNGPGRLKTERVVAKAEAHRDAARDCLPATGPADAEGKRRVVIEFSMLLTGEVAVAEVTVDEVGAGTGGCLADLVDSWAFRESTKEGNVTAELPFLVRPSQ